MGLLGSSPGPSGNSGKYTNQPLFSTVRSVSSKDIYDYESINLASPNYVKERDKVTMVTIDQFIINTPDQMLAFQGGFMREEAQRYREVPIGDAGTGGQNGQLWVDVNTKNLDGSVNTNFGRPFIGVAEPQFQYSPAQWDSYRGQLAYRLDLSKNRNWTRWLGSHYVSPYYEYKYRVERRYSYRDAMASQHTWLAEGQPGVTANFARANNANITGGPQSGPATARPFFRWYVGDANGTNVDYAPGQINRGKHPFQWGTYGNWRVEDGDLELLATTSGTGGANNLKRTIKTRGAVIQDTWLDGMVVTTFGTREDKVYAKQGAQLQLLTNNNTEHDWAQMNKWEDNYRTSAGKTKTSQGRRAPLCQAGLCQEVGQ